jgi:hypothetical protein
MNTIWKCKRCGEIVDMEKFRCGCIISPSPWEPVMPSLNTEKMKEVHLWEVYILPNNQPTIKLGNYYAISAEAAMEMAAVDNQTSVDDCWGARKKSK